jgi:signal transduction histidine kinase
VALGLLIGLAGALWEVVRFGTSDTAAMGHLEREVRDDIARRADRVETLARRAIANPQHIIDAIASRDALPVLFTELASAAPRTARDVDTVTIYVADRQGYRVLAWSDGPAGEVATDLLGGPSAHFVARGSAGLRLVFVLPLEAGPRRLAVAVAETVLAPVNPAGAALFPTRFGAVTLVPPPEAGAASLDPADGFVIESNDASTLVEVRYAPADPAAVRREFRRRVLAAAGVLPTLALLYLVGPLLDRRRRTRSTAQWLIASALALIVLASAAAALVGLARLAHLPPAVAGAVAATAIAAGIAIVPGGWWWRPGRRLRPGDAPLRFASEALLAGAVLAGALVGIHAVVSRRITPERLANWRSALFPLDFSGLLEIWTILLMVLAIGWGLAALFGSLAARWRLGRTIQASAGAAALWLAPLAVVLAPPMNRTWVNLPASAALFTAGAVVLFALFATSARRYYRRTTQSMRLVLAFVALLLPIVAVYPLLAVLVDRATRRVIEHDYAPQTASQPDEIRAVVLETQDQIDRLTALPEQLRLRAGQPVDSQTAFSVWKETSLSTTRVVSDIELYGPDLTLISRFTLNLPDYVYRAQARTWEGSGCTWEVSGDVTRFGARDRTMLHAQRGVCDRDGQLVGAVVLHVAPADYSALPFLATVNPYGAVLGMDAARPDPTLPGLEVVVYGWSLQPLFTSSEVAWTLDPELFGRLYRDGASFWATRNAEGREYDIYFTQNRAGIYALGYPVPTAFEHAARLAEIVAVTAALFVLVQLAALVYAPVLRRPDAPLRVLLHEIRTSFYRKLFLFFVFVAIGPVFLFTLGFGAYMTAKFRADVEAEAETVVTAARRVFEQVAAAEEAPGERLVALSDDLMVWIRQLLDEDVNLFDGSELVATSQRDLYNSGLLPTRTPAILYRRIVLDRLPTFVAEDRQYLVAASPLPVRGADAILSVPLAPRQQEISEEIDELYRGVLVGAVLVVVFAAGLGAWLASRVSDPVARLTKATRQIAAGRLDVRIAADTADELGRLVEDFNSMTATLVAQRTALARTNQLKAWNEMARQVAHEIKNPLTPIQLAAEHLQRVHGDQGRPLGRVFDQCLDTILSQVRLLRRIASDFANFAAEERPRPEPVDTARVLEDVVGPYRLGLTGKVEVTVHTASDVHPALADRTMLQRALTNVVENAIQAMPDGGRLVIDLRGAGDRVVVTVSDTGVGMDADALGRAFEPYFSTKTGGSGLGLANARRTLELQGGTIQLTSTPGQGTSVTITLPAAPRPGAPGDAPGPSR